MKNWDIAKTQYKVSDFISWQRSGSLVLSPSFQRRPVWKPGAKSYLVDTIVRGLPIPILFIRERVTSLESVEPSREVVDGQQRIRTLISYIAPQLLKDFKPERDDFTVSKSHNKDLAKKRFAELADGLKRRLLDYQFSVHVLSADTDDREILQIFARMNSTGTKLNAQELRNAEFFGEFKSSMYNLALEQLPRWRKWKVFTEDNIARMEEVELVSELAMLIINGPTGKTPTAIDSAYDALDETYPEKEEVERRFKVVMDQIDDRMGEALPFSVFRRKALFYPLFAAVHFKMYDDTVAAEKKTPRTPEPKWFGHVKAAGDRIASQSAPATVLEAAARRTTHSSSRTTLIDYLS